MERKELFQDLISSFDKGVFLVSTYDSMPHKYGSEILYQTEMHLLRFIGRNPQTTATAIAVAMNKTVSACSQMLRKLRNKGLIEQVRNESNNREYYLQLTELGWKIFEAHEAFDTGCMERTYEYLGEFSDTELMTYMKIQERLNQAFTLDVQENKVELE